MSSASAAEGIRIQLSESARSEESAPETEFPQGLKPNSTLAAYGTAKAVPLQPQKSDGFSFRWTWWALTPVALVCAAILTPYLLRNGSLPIGFALERGFALVCHQRPERSFWMFGGQVAVCARCLGIYCGAALGLLLRTSRRTALQLLIAAAALNLLDVISESFGLHTNWLNVRFAPGLALGAAAAILVSVGVQGNREQHYSRAIQYPGRLRP